MLQYNYVLKQFLFILLVSLFIISCSNSGNGENQNNTKQNNSITSSVNNDGKSKVYTSYNLPLPVEVYKFLRDNKFEFDVNLLSSKDKKSNAFTELDKALNLGFYSSDLAYCTLYDQGQESVDYFSVSIELAQELDITEGYDELVLDRTYDNIENNDSLSEIAEQAYWKTCNYLENNNKVNILPFIIVGSWIESMHILSAYAENYEADINIYSEIYRQKESLKNLIYYLFEVMNDSNAFIVNDDIQIIIDSLKLIQNEYDKIKSTEDITKYKNEFIQISKLITLYRSKHI